MLINSISNYKIQSFQAKSNNKSKKEDNLRPKVIATTVLATGAAFAAIAKKQGFSLNPAKILKTPIKDWALFKLYNKKRPDSKLVELEGPQIITLAASSVAGGLAGGLIFDDKKYAKSKLRESVNQMLGNVLVPICCVWGASEIYKKYKANILKAVPQVSEKGAVTKCFNKVLKALPGSAATIASLGVGILAGNRVSNFINEKVFHKKIERKIKTSDFAPHVDDLGMAVSLMAEKSAASSFIQRIVPAFLCVPGVEVGMHKD